jgi:hypothetical protein
MQDARCKMEMEMEKKASNRCEVFAFSAGESEQVNPPDGRDDTFGLFQVETSHCYGPVARPFVTHPVTDISILGLFARPP